MTVILYCRATDIPFRPAWQGGTARTLQEVTCAEARCWLTRCELVHWLLLPRRD